MATGTGTSRGAVFSASAIARTRSGVDTLSASATKCVPREAIGASIAAHERIEQVVDADAASAGCRSRRTAAIGVHGPRRPAGGNCRARRDRRRAAGAARQRSSPCGRRRRAARSPPRACCAHTHPAARARRRDETGGPASRGLAVDLDGAREYESAHAGRDRGLGEAPRRVLVRIAIVGVRIGRPSRA